MPFLASKDHVLFRSWAQLYLLLFCFPLFCLRWAQSCLVAPDTQHSVEAVQALSDPVASARYFKEGARKQAVENSGMLLLREWGFGSCQMLMLWSMRDFLTIAVHF